PRPPAGARRDRRARRLRRGRRTAAAGRDLLRRRAVRRGHPRRRGAVLWRAPAPVPGEACRQERCRGRRAGRVIAAASLGGTPGITLGTISISLWELAALVAAALFVGFAKTAIGGFGSISVAI